MGYSASVHLTLLVKSLLTSATDDYYDRGTDVDGNPVNSMIGNPQRWHRYRKHRLPTTRLVMWYIKKFDITTMFFPFVRTMPILGLSLPSNGNPCPPERTHPVGTADCLRSITCSTRSWILINRYELIRMSQQALPVVAGPYVPDVSVPTSAFGNMDVLTFGMRYYPFISSRAGFAYHAEYSILAGSAMFPASHLVGFDNKQPVARL